jgi:hypothetical protein
MECHAKTLHIASLRAPLVSAANALAPSRTVAPAMAVRLVLALSETSTIDASPRLSMWLKGADAVDDDDHRLRAGSAG